MDVELKKIEKTLNELSLQEKKRKQDLLRYQKKRASDHRRTKKRMAEAQKNVNKGTRKNRPVLKASSSPVDEPYMMENDAKNKYLDINMKLQNAKQELDRTSQRMLQMEDQPIPKNMLKSEMHKRSVKMKSMKNTHAQNLKRYTKLIGQLDEPIGEIATMHPMALLDYRITEKYNPQYAIPSDFTGSPTISEGEFDSLSPPNYMQNMPSLTGFKLTGDHLANMERSNEMSLVRQMRDSQAMPVPSSGERKSSEGITDIERARQEADLAIETAKQQAITDRMMKDSGLIFTAQDERDIAEELEQMMRDAEGNRKRHTRRKHKKKKHKKQKKKTHKKKKKRRKKKGGTRKNRRR